MVCRWLRSGRGCGNHMQKRVLSVMFWHPSRSGLWEEPGSMPRSGNAGEMLGNCGEVRFSECGEMWGNCGKYPTFIPTYFPHSISSQNLSCDEQEMIDFFRFVGSDGNVGKLFPNAVKSQCGGFCENVPVLAPVISH